MKKLLFVIGAILTIISALGAVLLVLRYHPLAHFESNRLVLEGRHFSSRGQYRKAITLYDEALKLCPNDAEAYVRRAYGRVELQDYAGAKADADVAVQLDPSYALAYARRGLAKEWLVDYAGAHNDFDKAIALQPGVAQYYDERGWTRYLQNDADSAIGDFNHAVEISPQMADAYNHRAVARTRKRDYTGAQEDCDKVIQLRPNIAKYYANRAWLRLCMGTLDGALTDVNLSLALQPNYARAQYYRGVILRRQGKYNEAIASLDRALQLDSTDKNPLFSRAIAKYDLDDFAGAQADFQACLSNFEHDSYTRIWLWLVACQQSHRADADLKLSAYLAEERKVRKDTWSEKLGDLLLGRTTPETLVQKIDGKLIERTREDEVCQAWFYAGELALVNGNKSTAHDYFGKALISDATDSSEFFEAQRELRQP